MQKYILNTIIIVVSLYIIFGGLVVGMAVLDLVSWTDVRDCLIKGALIAALFFVINAVVALLTQVLPHAQKQSKKK